MVRRYRRKRRFNARKAVARLYRAVKPEIKKLTLNLGGIVPGPQTYTNQQPFRYDLTKAIVQGVGNDERVGRTIKIRSFICRMFVRGPKGGTDPGFLRAYLCRENDVQPTPTGTYGDDQVPVEWDNMNFHERRWLPKDRMMAVSGTDGGIYAKPLIMSYKFKRGGMKVMYNTGTGYQDPLKNQLTFNLVSSLDKPTLENNIQVDGTIRVYYTDC